MATKKDFLIALRGYDMKEVDALLAEVEAAVLSEDPARRALAAETLRQATFKIKWRGYDRMQVDGYLAYLQQGL